MQWRDANRMWWANYMREWRAKNPGYDKRSTYCHGRLRIKPEIWDTLVEFFGGCAYCGGEATEMDHFIPKALGGSDDWDNLVPACRTCNASKNDTHPKDWEPSKSLWRILSEQRENPGEGNPREGESHPQRLSERTPVTG
jgi:5-methylcytosine-specific restriction endonuclease McrA